jgi:RNA polymerase sigma-70 factor, ECF subfamily
MGKETDFTTGEEGRFGAPDSPALHAAIAAAKAGDPMGMQDLYARFSGPVFRHVRGIVGDRDDAEDITQAVFAKLAKALLTYERRGVPFSAWVRRVARNEALDHLRARRSFPVEHVHLEEKGREELRGELLVSLRTAFGCLPAGQREVVVLRHVTGLSPSEIATRLGKTEASVHALHHRGRARLVATLTELQATPNVA